MLKPLAFAALLALPALAAMENVESHAVQEKARGIVEQTRQHAPQRVSPALWRSSRLDESQLAGLYDLGIKTILNLENGDELRDEKAALARIEARRAAAGLPVRHISQVNVPLPGLWRPKLSQIDAALAVLSDPAKAPVLVHCKHGEDRTGVVVAAYRTEIEKSMTPEQASAEAKSLNCCHLVMPGDDDLREFLAKYHRHRQGL